MIKNKTFRRLALLVSLVVLLTSTVNTTFGFIVTKTDSIVNTFTPVKNLINDLVISKTVEHPFGEGYVIPDDIVFDFKVDFGELYANTTIQTKIGDMIADENGSILISIKPGEDFAFDGIDAGTKVTVTEISEEGSGFTVKDGAVTKEGTVAEDGSLKFEYVNVYAPASVQPVNVTVGGTKILEGRDWQSGDSFSFTLEQKNGEDTWVSLGTKTVTYDAENPAFNQFDFTGVIQALTFDKAGTYSFRMAEVVGDLENVDYDKSVNTFTIKVTDTDMDGKLEVNDVTAAQNTSVNASDGNYTVSVIFNNTFVPTVPAPEDIEVDITVNKTVKNTGTSAIGPDGFEVVLENTVSGEKFALNTDKNGKAVFTLPFTASDVGKVFTYKVYETNEGETGVTYDNSVYEISVAVTLDADKLIATVIVNGNMSEKPVVEFVNTYHMDIPDVPPTGDNSHIAFWLLLMIVSSIACVVLVLFDRRYAAAK